MTSRRVAGALAAFAVLVVGVLGFGRATSDTSAAWTNPADFVASASSGSWTAANPLGTCVVVSGTAPYDPVVPAPACTITALTYTGYGDGAPVGSRHANMYFTVTATVANGQLIKLSVNLQNATGMPADWVYATSGIENGSVSQYPGFACSSMSTGMYTALSPAWTGGGTQVYLGKLDENRNESGKHNFTCLP
jgi:hypothetical protein